jgi:taurine dioxygenase
MKRFAARLGPVKEPVAARAADDRFPGLVSGVSVLDQLAPIGQGADSWHSDHMFMAVPPMATMLAAVQLPSVGGDTCFANMYAAYEGVSAPLRDLLDGVRALNSGEPVIRRQPKVEGLYKGDVTDAVRPAEVQPVVRVHPETGRKALYVCGNFTTRIVELSEQESGILLGYLFNRVTRPEIQCRFRWTPGAVALWDNRAVQHCGVPDYDERRVMLRVLIDGDPVVGTFGPPSAA